MLGFLTPRKELDPHNGKSSLDLPTVFVATGTARRSTRIALPTTVSRVVQPRPPVDSVSSFALGGSTHLHGDEPQHPIKTPREHEKHKKSRSKGSRSRCAKKTFQDLPKEVYACIIAQVELLHSHQDQACPACYSRDLHSLSLVNRAWDRATIAPMYGKIRLFTSGEHSKLPKVKIKGTSRLKLLRRTLRDRPALARHVLELHLPDFQTLYRSAAIEREDIVSAVASLIMACPNLERVVGFHIDSSMVAFDRVSHALSTRTNLRQKVWSLQEDLMGDGSENEDEDDSDQYYCQELDPTERFLELNANHKLLTTFVLHQSDASCSSTLNFRAIIGSLRQFPHLQHVSISGLMDNAFTSRTLNALPPNLQSLRLEKLAGIDEKGLQRFTSSHVMTTVRKLSLINLHIMDLATLSNVLSPQSAALEDFCFAQAEAPRLFSCASALALPPFHSRTLRRLHWEIRSDAGCTPPALSPQEAASPSPCPVSSAAEAPCCLATSMLAMSIRDGCLPSLRRIRIPHDPQGVVQALCKPLATALLRSDAAAMTAESDTVTGHWLMKPRADSAIGPLTPSTIGMSAAQTASTPLRSRLAAEARILTARREACITVRIYDTDNHLAVTKRLGGFLGRFDSNITYDLGVDESQDGAPVISHDFPDRNPWFTNVAHVVGHSDKMLAEPLEKSSLGPCGHRIRPRPILVEELF
ncbi:hypothetical protein ACEQ8H_001448 [Pleosporales sp. CAS-2024a]